MVGVPFIGGLQGRFMFLAQRACNHVWEASGFKLSEIALMTKAVLFFACKLPQYTFILTLT